MKTLILSILIFSYTFSHGQMRGGTEYIDNYTHDRPQRGLGVLTPMEFHEKQRLAA